MTTVFNLASLRMPSGTYQITVVAKADAYFQSEKSNAVTYTKTPGS